LTEGIAMNTISEPGATDLAGREYWQRNWKEIDFRRAMDPRDSGLNNYVILRFHDLLRSIFVGLNPQGKKLIELGCGSSEWLPYLAKEFGFKVFGLDYSEKGCELASKILDAEGIDGQIVVGDLFAPPASLRQAFDVAVSFGVAEHFTDTARCLQAMAEYLLPGGHLFTLIPNMTGLPGAIQRRVDKTVYAKHVPIDRAALEQAHRAAGLKVMFCDYFLACNLGVINIESWKSRPLIHSTGVRVRSVLSKLVWIMESRVPFLRPNRWTSPYIVCYAMKP